MKQLCRVIACVLGTSLWAMGAIDEDGSNEIPVKAFLEKARPAKRKGSLDADAEATQQVKKPKMVRFRSRLSDPTPPAERGVEGESLKVLKSILKKTLSAVPTEEEEVPTDVESGDTDIEADTDTEEAQPCSLRLKRRKNHADAGNTDA